MSLGVFQGCFGRVSLFRTGQSVYRHAHPQFNVMLKMLGPDESYMVRGTGPCPLTCDKLILLNPWTPHANRRSAFAEKTTVLSLYLEANWVRTLDGRPVSRVLFTNPSAIVTAEMRSIADHLTHLLVSTNPVSSIDLEAVLQTAFVAVMRTYSAGVTVPASVPPIDGRVRRAVDLMHREARTGIKIDAICREVGLSRTRFYDRFQNSLGVSPRLFIDGLRLDVAIEMLARSRRSISDVSSDLGFAAQSQFTRFFKEKTGFSPSAYRRSLN